MIRIWKRNRIAGLILLPVLLAGCTKNAETTSVLPSAEAVTETSPAEMVASAADPEIGIETVVWEPWQAVPLPAEYQRRQDMGVPDVKDQGNLGTCWAFASLMALKSSVLPDRVPDFSEDHMSNNENFVLTQYQGGEYTMALAYLLSWQGPVLEEEDPYGDFYSPEGLQAAMHLQGVYFLPEKDYDAIKQAVYQIGGVQSSLYTQLRHAYSQSYYYNQETGAYCYNGGNESNHEVVIVGWDDNYPRGNFSVEVPGDGAFLCANSWGSEFAEDGFFYVSYYDTTIGIHNVVYSPLEDNGNYDCIYQSDLCGWIGSLGYAGETAWAANVYQTVGPEILKSVGFYALGKDTEYEIYVVPEVPAESDFSERKLVARGRVAYSGYYTIPLDAEVMLAGGTRFAVMIRLTTPGSVHPIAIEYDANDDKSRIDLEDGEGYISIDGVTWENTEAQQQCNICLKAYTDRQ